MSSETDSGETEEQQIRVGWLADDESADVNLPVVQVLTGRGFVTGKSGSGKSNTASVVVEEMLEAGYPVLIVDTDGEYYGLKEEYELLHAGADEECDIQVSPEHAEKIAALALEQNVPVILDVSGYLDESEANELLRETARHLFAKEKKLKKPFLLVIEECHEYIPEGGGMDETGKMLIKIGKRGRKHGLGIVGISQRPADVKKDFITQANWLVWHRLTWENDTKVVGRIVGGEYGAAVSDLDAGEAFVQTDWTEADVRRVQFKRKRTFDAGATPGLDDFERPELKSVSDALVDDLAEISEIQEQEENRIARLESDLERKDERIAELEAELDRARDISSAARKMANAVSHGDVTAGSADVEERLEAREQEVQALRETVEELETAISDPQASLGAFAATEGTDEDDERSDRERRVAEFQAELRRRGEELREEAPTVSRREDSVAVQGAAGDSTTDAEATDAETIGGDRDALAEFVASEGVTARIDAARRESNCNERHAGDVVDVLTADGPITAHEIESQVGVSIGPVQSLLAEFRSRELVTRDADRRYAWNLDRLSHLAGTEYERERLGELHEQWRA